MHFFGYLCGGNLIGPILAVHHLYVQHEKEINQLLTTRPRLISPCLRIGSEGEARHWAKGMRHLRHSKRLSLGFKRNIDLGLLTKVLLITEGVLVG